MSAEEPRWAFRKGGHCFEVERGPGGTLRHISAQPRAWQQVLDDAARIRLLPDRVGGLRLHEVERAGDRRVVLYLVAVEARSP